MQYAFYEVTGKRTHVVAVPKNSTRKTFKGTTTLCGIKYGTKGVRNLDAAYVRTDGDCGNCRKKEKQMRYK